MAKIRFQQGDISAQANPPAGQFVVMYDTDGKLKQKDSLGVITEIGSAILPVLTDYPTTTPLKAGQRFIYKGNEWHYMTQEEIDSTGWTGLVDVGFPAPVNKNLCEYIYFTGATLQVNYEGSLNLVDNSIHVDFLGLGHPENIKRIVSSTITSLLPYGVEILSFKNASLLSRLEDSGTDKALNFINNSLTSSIINELFTQLPNTLKTVTIDVSNNPGAATCDPSIATAKGYTVIT